MFRHKSLALVVRLFFVLILLFQTTSPALAARQNKQNPTPTFTPTAQPSNTPTSNACLFYPIALSAQTLAGVNIGDSISDIYNGSQSGTFGWLTWVGDQSTPALAASLTPPGNSSTYVNPNNPFDHTLSTGDGCVENRASQTVLRSGRLWTSSKRLILTCPYGTS